MNGNPSASDAELVSRDRVCAIVQGVLRGAAATWTDDALSAASGVAARTIKSYRVEGKEPSLANALSLACVIGPRALNPLLALIGYVAQPLDEADALDAARIVAALLPEVATIASAAADGRIDHLEQPLCQRAADRIIETVLPMASAAGAA